MNNRELDYKIAKLMGDERDCTINGKPQIQYAHCDPKEQYGKYVATSPDNYSTSPAWTLVLLDHMIKSGDRMRKTVIESIKFDNGVYRIIFLGNSGVARFITNSDMPTAVARTYIEFHKNYPKFRINHERE